MNGPKLLLIVAAAFCLPIAVVAIQHRDEVQKRFEIDPRTVKGRLLYFTSTA